MAQKRAAASTSARRKSGRSQRRGAITTSKATAAQCWRSQAHNGTRAGGGHHLLNPDTAHAFILQMARFSAEANVVHARYGIISIPAAELRAQNRTVVAAIVSVRRTISKNAIPGA
jgi:hypothetical protein